MRTVKVFSESWPLHVAFESAIGLSEAQVVVVEISEHGVSALGECTPCARFDESPASVMAQIDDIAAALEAGMTRDALQLALPRGAARNAVDSALWQLESALDHTSLWQLSNSVQPATVTVAQTIRPDVPEMMASSALALVQNGTRLLKVEMDDHLIAERLVAVRAAVPQVTIIVDAKESWHIEGLAARCQLLADLGVAMLEQPLPAGEDAALANFIHPLPICADESCHSRSDLPAIAERYDMINIKLDKTGGLTEALALAEEAHGRGLALMLDARPCTSRAIRMALPLVPYARFANLDAPAWLVADAEPALIYRSGQIDLLPGSDETSKNAG